MIFIQGQGNTVSQMEPAEPYRFTTTGVDSWEAPSTVRFFSESGPVEAVCNKVQEMTLDVMSSSSFRSLPNELIDYILSFLDAEPPSVLKHSDRPSLSLTTSTILSSLKSLSLTCHALRTLTLRRLFQHSRLDPVQLTSFLAFVHDHSLSKQIHTIVAVPDTDVASDRRHPIWWARLLRSFPNLTTLTILSYPANTSSIFQVPICDSEQFAFNSPYHIFCFQRPAGSVTDESVYLDPESSSIWTCTPWTSISINEGSSLKAYSFYEYFLRRTPSLFASLNSRPCSFTQADTPPDLCFASILSFEYTAIFPFYNHVDDVLKNIRKMRNIHTLTTKLCHSADENIILDEGKENMAKVDMNDAWMEFHTSYNLIRHTVDLLGKEGKLRRWQIKDIEPDAPLGIELVTMLTEHLPEEWNRVEYGTWDRIVSTVD